MLLGRARRKIVSGKLFQSMERGAWQRRPRRVAPPAHMRTLSFSASKRFGPMPLIC